MSRFFQKQIAVEATQLKTRMTLETECGVQIGEPGDWLVISLDGDIRFVKDAPFRKEYEPVNGYYGTPAPIKIVRQNS